MESNNENLAWSVADLMTGVMFVFIIALVAYMLTFDQQHTQERQMQSDLRNHLFIKSDLINSISKALSLRGVAHTADPKEGLIRFSRMSPSLTVRRPKFGCALSSGRGTCKRQPAAARKSKACI